MKNLANVFISVCVFLSCAALCFAQNPKKLQVGAVLSLTGMASAHGNAIQDGLELAKSDLQKQGWDISIRYEDDGTEPRRTVSGVEAVANSGIRFFVGPTWGILAQAAAPVFLRQKALSLQPCNSSDFVHGVNDRFFFFFSPPSTAQAELTKFVKEQNLGGRGIAIINNISDWGTLWQKLFETAAKEAGVEVKMVELFQFGDNASFPALVTKLKRENIGLILSTTTKESAAILISALEKQQFSTTFLSPDLSDTMSEKLHSGTSDYVAGFGASPRQSKSFLDKFTAWKGGEHPRKYADSGYDALMALATAVEKVGDNPEAVKGYFETSLDQAGMAGRVKFDSHHDVPGSGYEILSLIKRSSK